ncbi:hypothetical protein TRFO_22881 [Tritrichomonas foetus]|uniref:Uncharacterized protein n=1 Tax=Tritrichomonas foetus TaxID=1144522 RepID=A0A1J4KAV0_9EUKA|nr:hypothetical protein TRFO_22881 [Tritrichomonas foetus]|eukprot:OHT08545.1 hypothetical protein TRFO_22881 [Tritrichomonas foetus]
MDQNNNGPNLQSTINLEVSRRGRKSRKTRESKITNTIIVEDKYFTGLTTLASDNQKTYMNLKISQSSEKPLYVCPDGHIFFETFTKNFKAVNTFLNIVAQPVTLPKHIQEYQINTSSLSKALQMGWTSQQIIGGLKSLSKCQIQPVLIKLIENTCSKFTGKLTLLYSKGQYIVYSDNLPLIQSAATKLCFFVDDKNDTLRTAIPDTNILAFENFECLHSQITGPLNDVFMHCFGIDKNLMREKEMAEIEQKFNGIDERTFQEIENQILNETGEGSEDEFFVNRKKNDNRNQTTVISSVLTDIYEGLEDVQLYQQVSQNDSNNEGNFEITPRMTELNTPKENFCFLINHEKIVEAKKFAAGIELQLLWEYDYQNDKKISNLEIDYKNDFILTPYQCDALTCLFQNSFFKSGIITLPYSAGKTVIGAITIAKMKKPTIIFCENVISVFNWIYQLKKFTNLDDLDMIKYLPNIKEDIPSEPCIVLTTYSFFLSFRSPNIIKPLTEKEWGLIIFDEFKSSISDSIYSINKVLDSRSKLILSPFPITDDQALRSLFIHVGPLLYSKTWNELCQQNFFPKVQCYEVICKMTHEFFFEYLHCKSLLTKRLLAGLNPNKVMTLQRLIRMHEDHGDKIIVYADIPFILKQYAERLFIDGTKRRPYVTIDTPEKERKRSFKRFLRTSEVNCLFLSRIIDKAIEIPYANVFIQICSHLGSRVPEFQRIAKVLRPKTHRTGEHNAFFYTLVSEDTKEVFYMNKSRQFLIDEGLHVKTVQRYRSHSAIKQKLCCKTIEEQLELLKLCVTSDQNNGAFEILDEEKTISSVPKMSVSKNLPSTHMKRADYKNQIFSMNRK